MATRPDRLLSTTSAGEMIGGKNRRDVVTLIRLGRLKAKLDKPVRGTGANPHYLVWESEVRRYMKELPDAPADLAPSGFTAPDKASPEAPARRRPRRPSLAGVIQFV